MNFRNSMQLKALVNNYAVQHRLIPQAVLQNYHLQRFMERVMHSKFRDKFIIKGGLLMTAFFGLDRRTTMDIDATVTGIAASRDELSQTIVDICEVGLDDGFTFSLSGISDIADHNGYPGFRAEILAKYGRMKTRLTIDITTGDKITPAPMEVSLPLLFEERAIAVRAYTIETLLAEKLQTILVRGVLNTRPRDFYDIYLVVERAKATIRFDILGSAVEETFRARDTLGLLASREAIFDDISASNTMRSRWRDYQRKFDYARSIDFADCISAAKFLLDTAIVSR